MPESELPLVGRDAELALVHRMLDDAASGCGRAALVTGESGLGKTRLLREAQRAAKDRGLAVLRGRAVEDSGAYRPLIEALSRPSARLVGDPRLSGVEPVLARVLPSWMRASEAPAPMADPAVVLGEAVMELLSALAPDGALVVLDDLHWADDDTLAVLRYLADTAEELPLALVLAARGHPSLPPRLSQMIAARAVEAVELRRLTSAQVAALVTTASPGGLDPETVEQVTRAADGLPLVVDELVRHLQEATDAATVVGSVPGSVATPVQHRLAGLSRPSRDVLDALAVLGETDTDVLLAATGLDRGALARGLRDGLDSTLLVPGSNSLGVAWRHRLMREAVLALLLPLERQALARRAAERLDEAATDPTEDRLRQSASLHEQAGNPARASEQLVRAARAAVDGGALQAAEAYLDRAGKLIRTDSQLGLDVVIERLVVLTMAGRADDAYRMGVAALPSATGDQRRRLIVAAARAAVTADLHTDAGALLHEVRSSDDPAVRVLSAHAAVAADEPEQAAELARTAVTSALAKGRIDLACEAWELVGRARRRWDLDEAEAAFGEALALATAHGLRVWQVRALAELGTIDLFRACDATRFRQARAVAEEVGMAGTLALLDLQIGACTAVREGFVPAYPTLAQAESRAKRLRLTGLQAALLAFVAQCHVHAGGGQLNGRRDAASDADVDALLAEALALGEATVPVPWAGCTLGVRSWLRGDEAAALAQFEAALAPMRAQRSQAPTPWWGIWALLHLVTDGTEDALDELVSAGLLGHPGNRGALAYGRALTAARTGGEVTDLLAQADQSLELQPYWRHLVRTMIAPTAAGLGVSGVQGWLREADAYCGEVGERALQERAREVLRALGAKAPRSRAGSVPPRLAALGITPREVEVLQLVTAGLSNAEVAGRLFLSSRTVETHVGNLLNKSGCRSRSELTKLV